MSEPVDVVNHPPHYTRGGIECADAMTALLVFAALWVVAWCVILIFLGGTDDDDNERKYL